MKSDVNSYQYVKKNGNDFSFISTFFSLIGNAEYGEEAYSTLCTDIDSSRNNIWRSLSATASYVGETVNTEILNYVDNICNVELCKIRQLQSLATYFGINYSIFQNIQLFPRELLQLMDVLSIKREYLADRLKVDHNLADMIMSYAQESDKNADEVALSISNERALNGFTWPDRYDNDITISVDFGKHLNDSKLDELIQIIIEKFLMSKLYMTYNDSKKTMICKHLSADILEKDFILVNPNEQEIHDYKLQWNISKNFDQAAELDKIENGEAELADYSNYEQHVIQLEKAGRDVAFNALEPATRFKYYKEIDVKEYYKFIEGEYYKNEASRLYNTAKQYTVDNNYIEVESLEKVNLLQKNGNFNSNMLKTAIKEIANTIDEIRNLREQLKTLVQKNFMKGTFMLMSYAVNEYLNNTIAPACSRLSNSKHTKEYDVETTNTDIVEYIDPTEYYNISCASDSNESLNQRYWETGKAMEAIGAIDDTNIFATPSTVDSQNIAFDSAALEQFYLQTLQSKFAASPDEVQSSHLYSFLCSIFDYAADSTSLSNGKLDAQLSNGMTISQTYSQLSAIKHSYDTAASVLVCCDLNDESTIRQQLDASISCYVQNWKSSFEAALNNCEEQIMSANADISTLMSDVNEYQQDLNSLNNSYKQLVINNMTYTGQYDDSFCSSFISRLDNYVLSIHGYVNEDMHYGFDPASISAVSANIQTTCNQLSAKYTDLSSKLSAFNENIQRFFSLNVDYTIVPVIETVYFDEVNVSSDQDLAESVISDLMNQLKDVHDSNISSFDSIVAQQKQDFDEMLSEYVFSDVNDLSSKLSSYLNYSAQISDFVNVQLPELVQQNISAQTEYKTALFKKYTGLEDSDAPYANLKNTVHPSYQIHPYLSTFVEQYDYSYPIENIVNATSESILKDLKDNIDKYIDDNGYLINLWKNPLNTNSDYISRYDKVSHIDDNNNQNKYFGYDGLFHPDALKLLTDDPDSYKTNIIPNNNVISNCYNGLDLTYDECQMIQKQITELSSAIKHEAESVHDIYRYGLDAYGNAYILVKDYGIDSIDQLSSVSTQDKKNTPGKLWLKFKNHPLALPAYVLSSETAIHTADISQLAVFGNEGASENALFTYSTIKKEQIEDTDYYTPLFYDFSISEDKTTFIAIAAYDDGNISCQLPLLATPVQKNSMDANINDLDITVHALDKVKDASNYIEALYYANEISDFQFQCFFNKDFGVGTAYLSSDNDIAVLKAAYYNNYTQEEHNDVKLPELTVSLEHTAADGNVTVDSYVDSTTGTSKLIMSYLTNIQLNKCSSYMSNDFNYEDLNQYISTTQKKIVTRDITIADNSLIKESEQLFTPFSDCGYNPVLSGSNQLAGTRLESALTAFPTVMKFQMIGSEKEIGIDFINALPVRMFENYLTNTKLSCADYRYIHFDEDGFEPISVGEMPIYDSTEFIKILSGMDATIRIDEAYKNELVEAGYSEDDLVDNLIKWPYLWNTAANDDFPQQFVDAFNPVADGSMDDNMKINVFEDHIISCSWKKIDDRIQIDFNSLYYTQVSSFENVFNRQHKFLSLKKAGEAGYLQEYDQDDQLTATYYIKNISDDKPKFLLSASFESQIAPNDYSTIVTEDNTIAQDEKYYYRDDLVLVKNNREYVLIAENL